MAKSNYLYQEFLSTRKDITCKTLIFDNLSEFKRLLGPGVYILKRGTQALYVGMAKNVLSRVTDDTHQSAKAAFKEADTLTVILCPSVAHAREVETEQIHRLQPKHNIKGKCNPAELEARDKRLAEMNLEYSNGVIFNAYFTAALHKELDKHLGKLSVHAPFVGSERLAEERHSAKV